MWRAHHVEESKPVAKRFDDTSSEDDDDDDGADAMAQMLAINAAVKSQMAEGASEEQPEPASQPKPEPDPEPEPEAADEDSDFSEDESSEEEETMEDLKEGYIMDIMSNCQSCLDPVSGERLLVADLSYTVRLLSVEERYNLRNESEPWTLDTGRGASLSCIS